MKQLKEKTIIKKNIETVQINLGNLCNQACSHCHIDASPTGQDNMTEETAEKVIEALKQSNIVKIELTGGTPELNPNLKRIISELSGSKKITVRTSLTILNDEKYADIVGFYADHGVSLIASLPALFEETTDRQRGKGVFGKSIDALKKLNEAGYGFGNHKLDLVYNPTGDYLPSDQSSLERDYKKILSLQHGIAFDCLLTIANVPIKRFAEDLKKDGRYDSYLDLLKDNYNPAAFDKVMCRNMLSVGFDGSMYDCDFNLAMGIKLAGFEDKKIWDVDIDSIEAKVTWNDYCYACTAGGGSSCGGELVEVVKQYYGDELTRSDDLKTDACCTVEAPPKYILDILPYIADEIVAKYYGCGTPIPASVDGLKILDLGSGTGKDSYVLSKLAGEEGFVTGIDMTANQIEVAKKYINEQMSRFGFDKPNIDFIHDYIENTAEYFEKDSLDLVVSNCVINLIKDKEKVLKDVYSLLKNGGEMYFSDIYVDRRLPEEIRDNPVLYGECMGGALYWKDFERKARRFGFSDPRVVSWRSLEVRNEEIQDLIGNAVFYSVTYRLWKIDGLEDACEDYGHVAVYRGGCMEFPHAFPLDKDHIFEKNRPERVCGNTAKMLGETRFSRYFEIIGSFDEHFGEYPDCETGSSAKNEEDDNGIKCSC